MSAEPQDETFFVPLYELWPSLENVRKAEPSAEGIRELAASIHSHGLLMPLLVTKRPAGGYWVEAGERRRRALVHLAEHATLPGDYRVRCTLIRGPDAAELSLTENLMREALSPADEISAFATLLNERGRSVEDIAATFGRTPRYVRGRLALASAHRELLAELRAGTIGIQQLAALCATDDTAVQLRVWDNAHAWERRPDELRRLVLRDEVPSHDARVRFVGLDAYRDAGGTFREDLFAMASDSAILADAGLLNRLVEGKLQTEAERIRESEGWAWAEVWPQLSYTKLSKLQQLQSKRRNPTETETARLAELREQMEQLGEVLDEDDGTEEQAAQYAELEAEERAIDESLTEYGPRQRAGAGIVVWWDTDEGLRVRRGLRRAQDERKAATGASAKTKANSTAGGGQGSAGEDDETPAISEKVRQSLLGYRNRLAQLHLAERPREARILLCTFLVSDLFQKLKYSSWVPLKLRQPYGGIEHRGQSGTSDCPMLGERQDALIDRMRELAGDLLAGLEEDAEPGAIWSWLSQRTDDHLDRIIAWGVANQLSLSPEHSGLTACLLEATRFDMAGVYTADRDTFWDHVRKPVMLQALTEAKGAAAVERAGLAKRKAGELAQYCERELDWCPALVRTPGAPWKAEPKPAGKKKAAKKKARSGGGA